MPSSGITVSEMRQDGLISVCDYNLHHCGSSTTSVTFYITMAQVGIPAACIAISKRLENIGASRSAFTTAQERRRESIIDLILVIGLPVFFAFLHIVVQGHRYNIMYNIGPLATTVPSWLSILIVYLPPLVLSLISCVYSGMFVLRTRCPDRSFQKFSASSEMVCD